MPHLAISSTATEIPAKRSDVEIVLQNLHASQNVYYGWGAVGSDVSSTKSLRLAAGEAVTLPMKRKPLDKELYVVASGADTPTIAYDVF